MYFDGTSTVSESLQYICEIGRGGLVNRANVLGVVIDSQAENLGLRNEPIPLFKFDDSNIVADSYSEEYRDRENFPSEVQVTYFDKDREYTRKSVLARTDEARLSYNAKDITLYPCNDIEVARDHAEYVLGLNKLKKNYSWTGDLDSMPLDLGDLVDVNGKLMTITGVSFDEELRREFKALEYNHERFGWELLDYFKLFHGGSTYTDFFFCMPISIPGATFESFFGIEGITEITAGIVIDVYEGGAAHEMLNDVDVPWEPNKLYIVQLASDVDPDKLKMYVKNPTLNNEVILRPGANFVMLNYDIQDYFKEYWHITQYGDVRLEHEIIISGGEIVGTLPIERDEYGRAALKSGSFYRFDNTTDSDIVFEMFPPN